MGLRVYHSLLIYFFYCANKSHPLGGCPRSREGGQAAGPAHEHAPQVPQVQVQGRRQLAPHQGPDAAVHGQGSSGDQIAQTTCLKKARGSTPSTCGSAKLHH